MRSNDEVAYSVAWPVKLSALWDACALAWVSQIFRVMVGALLATERQQAADQWSEYFRIAELVKPAFGIRLNLHDHIAITNWVEEAAQVATKTGFHGFGGLPVFLANV